MLVASDLDRTLIYSRAATGLDGPVGATPAPPRGVTELRCVEVFEGGPLSFMSEPAAQSLAALAAECTFVPVTTRTVAQLRRVQLPVPAPASGDGYAVAANGGVLLHDGEPDADWAARVAVAIGGSQPHHRVWAELQELAGRDWVLKLRSAEDLFCYAVLDRGAVPADFIAETTAWASRLGWRTSLQGRKLYWVPDALTKRAAVAEVARRRGSELVLAAGDSLLDIDLLEGADRGIRPAHGELDEQGWSAPHVEVTRARGVAAGAEILEWFREGVASHCGEAAPRLASGVSLPIR
ncbi:hypothetical protein SAMN05892883_1220 [Jatrophihabitans sp. GAS493]|nr:hypothetical protein SAMN05892883_1220 [Jatrophihabitans sp. GAS493]